MSLSASPDCTAGALSHGHALIRHCHSRLVTLFRGVLVMVLSAIPVHGQVLNFEDNVQPLLQTGLTPTGSSCVTCHSPAGGPDGNYDLTTFQGLFGTGTDTVPNVIPGVDAESRLLTRPEEDVKAERTHPNATDPQRVDVPLSTLDTLRHWIVFDNARNFTRTVYTDSLPPSSTSTLVANLFGASGFDCVSCHSPAGGLKGSYDLTSYQKAFGNGTDLIPNILPGMRSSKLVTRLEQDQAADPSNPRHEGVLLSADLINRIRDWVVNDKARFFVPQSYNADIAILLNNPPGGTSCAGACHISGNFSEGQYDLTAYENLFGNGSDTIPNVIPGDSSSRLVTRLRDDLAAGRNHPSNAVPGSVLLTEDYVNRIEDWVVNDFARKNSNNRPTAIPGAVSGGRVGIASTLTGSGTDQDPRDSISLNWTLDRRPNSSSVRFDNPGQGSFQFTPDATGTFTFALQATDSSAAGVASTNLVVAVNTAPLANAGPDVNVTPPSSIGVDGRGSSDPDGDTLTYSWVFLAVPTGSNVTNGALTGATGASPSFTADVAGTFVLELSVSDGQSTSTDRVEVRALGINQAPVANAGPSPTTKLSVGTRVTLTGTASFDPDGNTSCNPDGQDLVYTWTFTSVPSGSVIGNASLSPNGSAAASRTSFPIDVAGTYALQLVVNDGCLDSAPSAVSVNVLANSLPTVTKAVANENADEFLQGKGAVGNSVTLAGLAADADGDSLIYKWNFTSVAPGSAATVGLIAPNNSASAFSSAFIPPATGTYNLTLTANDGLVDSAALGTSFQANNNFLPVAESGHNFGADNNTIVTFDGSLTRDFETATSNLSFKWRFVSGPNPLTATFTDDTAQNPSTAEPLVTAGDYIAELVANDSPGGTDASRNSAPDTVLVRVRAANVTNTKPVANAGTVQPQPLGGTVTLNGTANDAQGDPIVYKWTFKGVPPGSNISDSDLSKNTANSANTTTFRPDKPGDYTLELVCSDDGAKSFGAGSTVTVNITNSKPTADAGVDQDNITIQDGPVRVFLNGSASTDVETPEDLTFTWSLISTPPGSTAFLRSADTAQPNFDADKKGSYAVRLTVSDGDLSSDPDTVLITVINSRPVASIAAVPPATVGSTITLNGTASRDPDGEDTLTFTWSIISRPPGSTVDSTSLSVNNTPTSSQPTFSPDRPGIYVVQLQVNDGSTLSAPAKVQVAIDNSAPVANAGADRIAEALQQVTLDGSGTVDPDGTPNSQLSFTWKFEQVPSSSALSDANLDNRFTATPRFTPDRKGTYRLSLTVSDGFLTSAPDTVDVVVVNSVPTPDAGPNQVAPFGAAIQLDGRSSFDSNAEDVLVYSWSVTSSPETPTPTSGRFNPNGTTLSARPFFTPALPGVYTIALVVSDGTSTSSADTMQINVSNNTPVVNAGPDQQVPVGNAVRLDGTGSNDPEGNPLTYDWSFSSVPPVSGSTLTDSSIVPNGSTTSGLTFFTPDRPGTYTVRLSVSDSLLTSGPDEVVITATNTAPVADAGFDQPAARRGTDIQLNGANSTDAETPNGLTYAWTFLSSPSTPPPAFAPSSTVAQPTFRAPKKGFYSLQLSVSDSLLTSNDTVDVTVVNTVPNASAGSDITTGFGPAVRLDGSGTFDPDVGEDTLTYTWTLRAKPGASTLSSSSIQPNGTSTAVTPSFRPDAPGTYRVGLVVNDGTADSPLDEVSISVTNGPPTARPVAVPSTAFTTTVVVLDGRGSTDPEGADPLSYTWSFTSVPTGSSVASSSLTPSATAAAPSFRPDRKGTYVARLVASDGLLSSSGVTTSVAVVNSAPAAAAGSDRTTAIGSAVVLDGSGSTDPDVEDTLSYRWTFASVPPVSGSTLTDSAFSTNDSTGASVVAFVPDRDGTYTVRLVVSDGAAASPADDIAVTVTNTAPTASLVATTSVQGNPIQLDGTLSTDAETPDRLVYRWRFLSLPPVPGSTITSSGVIQPNDVISDGRASFVADRPGTYGVQLVVSDGLLDSGAVTTSVVVVNSPPTAEAGPDFAIPVGATATLDGSRSTDPDPGDLPLIFHWRFVSLPSGSNLTTASLSPNDDTAAQRTTFVADVSGVFVVSLTVDDRALSSPADTLRITVDNGAPTAEAGLPVAGARVGTPVTLDGRGSGDPEGFALEYRWSFGSIPAGSSRVAADIAPNNSTGAGQASFTPDRKGTYVVQLLVNDGLLTSPPDTVSILVGNSFPVADAGSDRNVSLGVTLTLDGTASSDPDPSDRSSLLYRWTLVQAPSGSRRTTSDIQGNDAIGAAQPTFIPDRPGPYLFRLSVTDREGAVSPSDEVTLTVANTPPTADAGPDRTLQAISAITLDGSGSDDAETPDAELSFTWRFLRVPPGSAVGNGSLNPSNSDIRPSFIADRKGTYTVELIVSDGTETARDEVSINVVNTLPAADTSGTSTQVAPGQTVTLVGSATDPDGEDELTYRWSFLQLPSGSALSPSSAIVPNDSPAAFQARFTPDVEGAYGIALVVSDGTGESAPSQVTVNVQNTPPIALAGPIQQSASGSLVTLDGSATSDGETPGGLLVYSWRFDTIPPVPGSTLDSSSLVPNNAPGASRPSFRPDRKGTYAITLSVSDGSLSSTSRTAVIVGNSAPVAAAGPDKAAVPGVALTLDGSASSDVDVEDQAALVYNWRFVSVPAGSARVDADITPNGVNGAAGGARPSFTPDVAGTYRLELVMSDGFASSTGDTVDVIAATGNIPPSADPGSITTAPTGGTVTLDATRSTDLDGSALTYQWRIVSQPTNSRAKVRNSNQALAQLDPDIDGTYVLELTVSDGFQSDTALLTITAKASTNLAPVADAGPDRQGEPGATLLLDGSRSFDPNLDPLAYLWTQTAGPETDLGDPTRPTITLSTLPAGTYQMSLTVSDGRLTSPPDTVQIRISSGATTGVPGTPSPGPSFAVDAGPSNQVARPGSRVALQGTLKSGALSAAPQVQWTLLSGPPVPVSIQSAASLQASFVPPVPGTYTFRLRVTDTVSAKTAEDLVTVMVSQSGQGAEGLLAAGGGGGGGGGGCRFAGPASAGSGNPLVFLLPLIPLWRRRREWGQPPFSRDGKW